MGNIVDPKFPDCRGCFFFNRSKRTCAQCDSGEYFEERVEELDPDSLELQSGTDDDE